MFEKILILAPHTDDGEIGCGGTITRLIEEGKKVYYVAFSIARASVPPQFPGDILKTEVENATQILGIEREKLIVKDFPVRFFPKYRQEILEDLIKIKQNVNPDLIFLPCSSDIHQDHNVIYEEGLRAFKRSTILGYEEPWNNLIFTSNSLVPLKRKHVENKIAALECYNSQKKRNYITADFVFSMASIRGAQINTEYAEAFEVIRWIY